jgi:hypothetical protein
MQRTSQEDRTKMLLDYLGGLPDGSRLTVAQWIYRSGVAMKSSIESNGIGKYAVSVLNNLKSRKLINVEASGRIAKWIITKTAPVYKTVYKEVAVPKIILGDPKSLETALMVFLETVKEYSCKDTLAENASLKRRVAELSTINAKLLQDLEEAQAQTGTKGLISRIFN